MMRLSRSARAAARTIGIDTVLRSLRCSVNFSPALRRASNSQTDLPPPLSRTTRLSLGAWLDRSTHTLSDIASRSRLHSSLTRPALPAPSAIRMSHPSRLACPSRTRFVNLRAPPPHQTPRTSARTPTTQPLARPCADPACAQRLTPAARRATGAARWWLTRPATG